MIVLAAATALLLPHLSSIEAHFETVQRSGERLLSASAKVPVFTGDSLLVPVANEDLKKLVTGRLDESLSEAAEHEEVKEVKFQSESHVETLLPTCVGVWMKFTRPANDDRPAYVFDTRNYGIVKGKAVVLKLKNLFTTDPSKAVAKLVINRLAKMKGSEYVTDGTVTDLSEVQLEQFVITRTGLRYMFEPQTFGPAESGEFQVLLKYGELPNLDRNGPLKDVLLLKPDK